MLTRTNVRSNILNVNEIKRRDGTHQRCANTSRSVSSKTKNAFPIMGVLRTAYAIPTNIIHIFFNVVNSVSAKVSKKWKIE